MNEFNNRIDAQRHIVDSINRKKIGTEELFGLSKKAIDRWLSVNRVEPTSRLSELIVSASGKLFFLANKSQDQVSPEYQSASNEVESLARDIDVELESDGSY
jgi:hypothetical protein